MSVTLAYKSQLKSTEILDSTPAASNSNKSVIHDQYDTSATLTSATTPPVTKCAYFEQVLTAGAATISLDALSSTCGSTEAMTGLKVQAFRASAPSDNGNVITLSAGTDAYNLAGASWQVALQPGQEFVFYGYDATPDVASGSADEIDLAGTGDTDSIKFSVVCG